MNKHLATLSTTAAVLIGGLFNVGIASASGSMSGATGYKQDGYSVGKSVFFKEVVCQSCAYAGRGKDATDAKELREAVNSVDSKVKLDSESKEALNTYLNERFKLAAADKK